MEKRKPHNDLAAFKRYWLRWCMNPSKGDLYTRTAARNALILGFNITEWTACIMSMDAGHFYKSMTSYNDNREWQDVYHVPWDGFVLYVKFTQRGLRAFKLLSFKELDDGRG